MTAECKRIKITSLISLAVGIAEIIGGFVIQQPFGVSIFILFVPIVAGVLALIVGVHASRAANVPSKAESLTTFALIMGALAIAAVAVALYFARGFNAIVALVCVPVVLDILIAIFSSQVKRANDK